MFWIVCVVITRSIVQSICVDFFFFIMNISVTFPFNLDEVAVIGRIPEFKSLLHSEMPVEAKFKSVLKSIFLVDSKFAFDLETVASPKVVPLYAIVIVGLSYL